MPRYEKFGKYLLLEELSCYYFGKSYRAARLSEKGLEQNVILLKINHDLSANSEFIMNLQEEIAICTELNGANVLKTLGMGKAENTFYITRQYIHGQPLKTVLQKCALKEIPFSVDHALFVAGKLCHTLEFTHSHEAKGKKVHHGNLSTTSIILSYDGTVNLSGFGLTSILFYLPEWKERILLRKDEYLSPEQMAGRQIDHRSDIFTAGVILFEMLTGDPFFLPGRGINFKTRIDSISANKSDRTREEIPDEIIQVLSKSIVNDPDGRYQDIKEMRIDLETGLITNNFHASKTTLGLFLDSIFREEIVEKTEQLNLEQEIDISQYYMEFDNVVVEDSAEKESTPTPPEAQSRETSMTEKSDRPETQSRETAAVPAPDRPEKEGRIPQPGRSMVSRLVTPLLVAGLTIIILLIVFFFIKGMKNSDSGLPITNRFTVREWEDKEIPVRKQAGTGTGNLSERALHTGTDSLGEAIPEKTSVPEARDMQDRQSDSSEAPVFHASMMVEEDPNETPINPETVETGTGGPPSEDMTTPEPASPSSENESSDSPSFNQEQRSPWESENNETLPSEDDNSLPPDASSQDPETTRPVSSETEPSKEPELSMDKDASEEKEPPMEKDPPMDSSRDKTPAEPAPEQSMSETHASPPLDEKETESFREPLGASDSMDGTALEEEKMPPPEPAAIIEPPVLTKTSRPRYSALAQQLQITGTLQLDLLISEAGQVLDVQAPDTPQNHALDRAGVRQSVIKAARKWTFIPATQNGQPVEQWLRINYQVTAE